MVRLISIISGLLSCQIAGVSASSKTNPSHLGLSILTENDLETDPSPGSGAILIDAAVDYSTAQVLCDDLSETLWTGKKDAALNSLVVSLAYQVHQGNYASGAEFWIGGNSEKCKCRTTDTEGSIQRRKCSERLPVLCSQSAPLSNTTWEDNSEQYQVTRNVGGAQITGFRDFFTWRFRGIRYAPEPRRFEYSTTMRNTTGPISALETGADCLQRGRADSVDDCLFMNIWTPSLPADAGMAAVSKTALKPVIFYIYGGALMTGSGSNPNLDMGNIASRGDVVGVMFNHRMGNLGLLVFDDGIHNGNIAINDQLSALLWVKENIAAFGGDPDHIILSGESSGAMSTRYLLTSPEAEGLYVAAHMQSDGMGGLAQPWGIFFSIAESYDYHTKTVLRETGCEDAADEVECLRQVPGEILTNLDIDRGTAKFPVLDGKYLRTSHFALDGSGPRYARDIPVMAGGTRDEGGLNDYLQLMPWDSWTFDTWRTIMSQYAGFFRLDLETILANLDVFGITPESTPDELFNGTAAIFGKSMFTCLDRAKAYSGSKNDVFQKVYYSTWNRTYNPPGYTAEQCKAPITPEHPYGDPSMEYFKCHGGTQLLQSGSLKRRGLPDRDGHDMDFSRLVIDYLASFAHSGDPNPDPEYLRVRGYQSTLDQVQKVARWEPVDATAPEEMILQWGGAMASFSDAEVCSVLDQPLDYWETL